MVTIKDVAKLAGVSHGTASNVLNKRGNVSVKKIQLVKKAAEQLGYQLNPQAQNLRKYESEKIFILRPLFLNEVNQHFINQLIQKLYRYQKEYDVIVIVDRNDFLEKFNALKRINPKLIISCGMNFDCSSSSLDNLLHIHFWGDSFDSKKENTISVDHHLTIKTIEKIVQKNKLKNIYCFCEEYDDTANFLSMLKYHFTNKCQIYRLKETKKHLDLFSFINEEKSESLLIFLSEKLLNKFKKIELWTGINTQNSIMCVTSVVDVKDDTIHYVEIDANQIANDVASNIIKNENKQMQYEPLYIENASFQKLQGGTIKLLTIDSPMTRALESVSLRYRHISGNQLEISTISYDELYDLIKTKSSQLNEYDLIRLDMAWLRSVDYNLFAKLDEYTNIKQILSYFQEKIRDSYSIMNQSLYALPLDISVQMLFYRRDIFEDSYFQRKYYEKTRLQLQVPKTFEEFDKISSFFNDKEIMDEFHMFGHTDCSKNPILAYSELMPRLREIQTYQKSDGTIEDAWRKYLDSQKNAILNSKDHWEGVSDNFSNGKTAMEILYSNYAFNFLNDNSQLSSQMIGVTNVPGGFPLLGGGCLAVLEKPNIEKVILFLEWLYSQEVLQILSYLGGFVVTSNNYAINSLQSSYPWLENFSSRISKGVRFFEGDGMNFEKEKAFILDLEKKFKNE